MSNVRQVLTLGDLVEAIGVDAARCLIRSSVDPPRSTSTWHYGARRPNEKPGLCI